MGQKVVIASRNQGKLREFNRLLDSFGWELVSLSEFEHVRDVVEDGSTFMENAKKKAMEVAKALQLPAIADDSGLCVEALNGAPGVLSARYAGQHGDDQANNEKLVRELVRLGIAGRAADDPARTAHFVCALVYYDPSTNEMTAVEGKCAGFVQDAPKGDGGFGYDPLFYLPQFGKTMAEISMEQKNRISHRSEALKKLKVAIEAGIITADRD